jgi:hypothetical protein
VQYNAVQRNWSAAWRPIFPLCQKEKCENSRVEVKFTKDIVNLKVMSASLAMWSRLPHSIPFIDKKKLCSCRILGGSYWIFEGQKKLTEKWVTDMSRFRTRDSFVSMRLMFFTTTLKLVQNRVTIVLS